MRKVFLLGLFMLLIPISMLAQNITVSGKVIDAETNESLVGVTVVQAGTTNGTITDLDGKYTLSVPSNSQLQFSYMGYLQQTLDVAGKTEIICSLSQDVKQIDEVVAVGYGYAKKSDLTGSVASVSEESFQNRATSDAASALQGKAAGVQVLANSGAPGTGGEIRVRGMSSNSSNLGPLLIVDGLKVDNIQYLDPENIEHMEILKDAASAAIYGAQAGNGVVLITTKKGSKSKNGQVFYNAQWQLASLSRDLEVMNAEQYINFGQKVKGGGKFTSPEKLDAAGYNGTDDIDWADEVFEPTWSTRHTIGFMGGNDQGSFYSTFNYVNTDGIFAGDKDQYTRYTIQLNADYKIKPFLKIQTNNNFEKWATKSVSAQNENGTALLAAITSDPLFGPLCDDVSQLTQKQSDALANGVAVLANEDGKYYRISPISGQSQSSNPFIQRDMSDSESSGFSVRGNTSLILTPSTLVPGLTFTSRFNYRLSQSSSHNYSFPFEANDFVRADNYTVGASVNSGFYYNWENFINYNKTFFDKHNVGLMVGMSWEENTSDNINVSSTGGDILKGYAPNFRYINYLKSDATITAGNLPGVSKSLSYFGRLDYNFDSKYYFQFNYRADAFDSSKLPSDARWGYFPSFSAGWVVTNESFVSDNISTKYLSFLKLKGSWGKNGSIAVLNGYPYSVVINANDDWYQYDETGAATYSSSPNGLPNPDLKWEESVQLDFGFDARFLDSRLSLSFDWYKKTTEGLLVSVTPVVETGVGTTVLNAGDVENKGIEFELGWQDRIGKLNYSVNANFSKNKNELTYLDPTVDHIDGASLQGSQISTRCSQGNELWFIYGYVFDSWSEKTAGKPVFKKDGDTEVMEKIGSGMPDFTYGFTVNLEYKGIDLSVFATGVHGVDILPTPWRSDRPYVNTYSWYYENSYNGDTKSGSFPALDQWSKQAFSSDLALSDGSYFKIKQIQLGYTLPSPILKKFKISNLRVFASLENFFTFTDYYGIDPEVACANTNSQLGIDLAAYPTSKQVIFGLNFSF